MKRIFGAILTAKLANFEDEPRLLGDALVSACVEVYNAITSELLPIPGKGHYVFNMRDLSKVTCCFYPIMHQAKVEITQT